MIQTTTPTTSTLPKLRKSVAAAFRPRPYRRLSEWVQEHIWLSEQFEATGGRYNLRDNPFFAEILDSMLDPDCRTIALMKSTQVGGTLTLTAAAIGIAFLDPAPSMLVTPDLNDTLQTRDRVYATADAGKTTKTMSVPQRKRNSRVIDLKTMVWYLAWAGSAQRLRGKPCKRVFRTEVDVYPRGKLVGGDPIKASNARVTRFVHSMIYSESTPREDPSVIDELHEAGDQRKWQCPCPECGHWQELRFFVHKDGDFEGCGGIVGYRDEHGALLPVDHARRRAKYKCEKGCLLTNTAVKEMVLRGQWVPKGCFINDDGKLDGEPEKHPRNRSYHLWRIHSPTKTLGELVEEYIDALVSNRLREFFENTLGRKYRQAKAIPPWKKLGMRWERPYARGTFPSEAFFLVGSADIQLDGVWWLVRAWGDQARSWLVDYGFVQRYRGSELEGQVRSDLAQLKTVMLDRYFETHDGRPNPFGKLAIAPRIVGLDSNHRPRDVHTFIVALYGQHERRIRAVRGEHPEKPTDERWKESQVERPRRGGEAYPGGPRPIWNLYTTVYKESLLEKYGLKDGEPGTLHFPSGISDWGKDYLQQITNEAPSLELDKRTSRPKTVWKVIKEQIGNHLWDCELYNAVLADVLLTENGLTWDAKNWVPDRPRVTEADGMNLAARESMSL